MTYVRRGFLAVALVCGWCLSGDRLRISADEPAAVPDVAQLIGQLDAPLYEVRQTALAELRALLASPELQTGVTWQLQRSLAQDDLSLEVRDTLEGLVAGVPLPEDLLPPVDPAQAADLLAELSDGRFVVRRQAADRLRRLAGQPGQAEPLLAALQRLQDESASADLQGLAAELSADLRRAWLVSDPANWRAPPLTDEQIAAWLPEIVAQADAVPQADDLPDPLAAAGQPIVIVGGGFNAMTIDRPGSFVRGQPWAFDLLAAATHPLSQRWPRQSALREFVDASFYDENVPALRDAVQAALADEQGLSDAARQRLEQLAELLLPTLVAELWKERSVTTVQFLFVDVPQFPQYAVRPTHFDRIDDETAHCASGNSLVPGEYPVNRAIAPTHPDRDPNNPENRMCIRLLNLQTPRRRMQYLYDLQRPQAERLRELSERSCAGWLADGRLLTERESIVLLQLDPAVVSQFVGPYLQQIDDEMLPENQELSVLGRTSSHALTCYIASAVGDDAALRGIRAALDAGRLRPPGPTALYDLGWLAAFELAGRAADPAMGEDPAAEEDLELDEWLAALVGDETPLMPGVGESGPELGATAAALLLRRHEQLPAEFDLGETPVPPVLGLSGDYYRFLLPGGRDRVRTWWERQKTELARAY